MTSRRHARQRGRSSRRTRRSARPSSSPGSAARLSSSRATCSRRACRPLAGTLLDFWQADTNGEYDNVGFRLRGHQFSDADGRYRLETITPAQYQTRTPHIHVKVQAPNRPVLTTQLYFPDHPRNAEDFIFQPELVMALSGAGAGQTGRFDFVLDLA